MAVAFYIPDQATLLRKASEQEQKIIRENHWKHIANVVLDALRQYVDTTGANYFLGRSRGRGGKAKLRKPTN